MTNNNIYLKGLAPICIFAYNRPDTLEKLIISLSKNDLAKESDLYIFSDGHKKETEIDAINEVRKYIHSIAGFRSITIKESSVNKGLANSVIDGVTEVITKYNKIIVLEDDLILSENFLVFMNKALDYYEMNEKVFSISGYSKLMKNIQDDIYFTKRASSLGWGTWLNRWNLIDWDITDYNSFIHNKKRQKEFNRMGSDMTKMLKNQMKGEINSWAIRWCYNQFLLNKYSVYPTISKVQHNGTDFRATHAADQHDRFYTTLDTSLATNFNFVNNVELDKHYLSQFLKQYSLLTRLKYKILNKLL
ncbi:MAG: glycosyltransferase [Dysgonomonas mossii]|uniref:glycosyltransferase n=1 Tax=Dysgonomonas mossii TaxID=163665 RepID=UPI001DB3B83A|nr:glycosyltransferase [Dysgonomonas mossii]MBS5795316.1 glycosyltransferase [Dysgonomonas mossii]MBS7109844.1 glycosyltransferase [Dysgonomonas mossii]